MAEPKVTGSRWKTSHIALFAIGSLVVLGLGFLVMVAGSEKSGVEFCPDDFTQREFSYAKIGWLDWTVRGITYENETSDFQRFLVSGGWVKRSGRTPKVWHLVEDSVSDPNSPDFDAQILINYLDSDYWEKWTTDRRNKSKAQQLWSAVATLARNNAYWAIPDLMDLASKQSSLSDAEFKAEIEKQLVDGLVLCGNSRLESEDFEAAIDSFSDAISVKETADVLKSRAQAYDEMNEFVLATKDRNAAKQLSSSDSSEKNSNTDPESQR